MAVIGEPGFQRNRANGRAQLPQEQCSSLCFDQVATDPETVDDAVPKIIDWPLGRQEPVA